MGIEQTVQRYFAGWNAHDAKSIAGLLAPDAIYEDPTTRMAVRSYDLASVVSSVAKVLPSYVYRHSALFRPSSRHSRGKVQNVCGHSSALGHSSVTITERYYAKWNKAQQDILDGDLARAWER